MQGGGEHGGGSSEGSEQGSFWQQSDLLGLMATADVNGTAEPRRRALPHTPDPIPASPGPTPASANAQAGPAGQTHNGTSAGTEAGTSTTSAKLNTAGDREHGCVNSADSDADLAVAAAHTLLPSTSERPLTQATPAASELTSLPACPPRLLILDTETTALSPQQGQCIEVGAVLFDVSSRSVLMQVSFLLPCERNPAQGVNGIPAAVSRLKQPWRSGLACFEAMVAGADALLAHNASFDRQWFGHGELPSLDKPWICSMEDIRWPAERQLRATPSVRDLALAYGVPVWAAHRALTDCIYLVQVFQRCEQLELLLQTALEPRRLVRARLSYDERQLAKDAGFRWNEPLPKAWSRRLSEREIAALPFAVDPVETEQSGVPAPSSSQQLWRRSA